MRYQADRRGFALPFYMAQQEVRIGVASKFSALAVNLAQSGINNVLVNETSSLTSMNMWDTTTLVDTVDEGVVSVKVTKVAMRIFYLDATATVTEGGALWSGATRRIGLVTRMSSANMDPPGALATQGNLTVGGSTIVDGYDSIPSRATARA